MSKESKEVVTFTCDCDGCGKKAQAERIVGKEFPYPYAKGWVYLHTFNWKHAPNKKRMKKAEGKFPFGAAISNTVKNMGLIDDHGDKHFCSRKHLLAWLTERIKTE